MNFYDSYILKQIFNCFRIIRYPFDGNLRTRTTALLLLLIWCFSICVSLPATLNTKYRYKTETHSWVCEFTISKTSYLYNVIYFAFNTLISITSLIIIYTRAVKGLTIKGVNTNNIAAKRRETMNKRVVKLFTVVVCTFAVLTIPFYIFSIGTATYGYYNLTKSALADNILKIISKILIILASFNSCVNPLIYSKMHKDIRGCVTDINRRFSNYFSCCCRKISM